MYRRIFLRRAAGLLALGISPITLSATAKAAQVVVVGGGFAGAATARYLKKIAPSLNVTLVEPNAHYFTCPTSNWTLSGQRELSDLQQNYAGLTALGITVIQQRAERLDLPKQKLYLDSQDALPFDRLVLAPGIDFNWQAIEGYDPEIAATSIPHAWKAGPQTLLLKHQLEAMPDGGTVLISAPNNPYRCPPAPYERASLIAYYLKQHKPKSKVIILDAKAVFAKQAAFIAGWEQHYGYGKPNALLEWVSFSADGTVHRLDVATKTLHTEFNSFHGDVINLIPPQQAPAIMAQFGLTDTTGFCPINPLTFESSLAAKVHVVGDSARADPLPKSAHSANSHAKVCAAAIVNLLNDQPPPEPHWVNTCYSLITPNYGISVVGMFKLQQGKIYPISGAGGVSTAKTQRAWEATYAQSWYRYITHDTFG